MHPLCLSFWQARKHVARGGRDRGVGLLDFPFFFRWRKPTAQRVQTTTSAAKEFLFRSVGTGTGTAIGIRSGRKQQEEVAAMLGQLTPQTRSGQFDARVAINTPACVPASVGYPAAVPPTA